MNSINVNLYGYCSKFIIIYWLMWVTFRQNCVNFTYYYITNVSSLNIGL